MRPQTPAHPQVRPEHRVFVACILRGHTQLRFGPFLTPELARKVGQRWGSPGEVVVAKLCEK